MKSLVSKRVMHTSSFVSAKAIKNVDTCDPMGRQFMLIISVDHNGYTARYYQK
jgi:hypothetical protein